jgi:hypothetical protein
MKTLRLNEGNFDHANTFCFAEIPYNRPCSLYCGYMSSDDGIYWAMLHASCLASSYSGEELNERKRLSSGEHTIANGETVLINGKQYIARFKGEYSDCATFEPVQ